MDRLAAFGRHFPGPTPLDPDWVWCWFRRRLLHVLGRRRPSLGRIAAGASVAGAQPGHDKAKGARVGVISLTSTSTHKAWVRAGGGTGNRRVRQHSECRRHQRIAQAKLQDLRHGRSFSGARSWVLVFASRSSIKLRSSCRSLADSFLARTRCMSKGVKEPPHSRSAVA